MAKQKTIEDEPQTAIALQPNPMTMLATMVEKGIDPDKLGKMMDLAERWQAKESEKAFSAAMNLCQQEMPTVVKDKINSQTNKKYAPVETVQTYAKPVYIRHGFSLCFGTEPGVAATLTTVYVDIHHIGGHVKRVYLYNVPLDDKGPKGGEVKTQVQGLMSSMSYAQGRLIKLGFNLTTADEDKDGRIGFVTAEQIGQINDAIKSCNDESERTKNPNKAVDIDKFKAWLNVEDLSEMSASKVQDALNFLELKRTKG